MMDTIFKSLSKITAFAYFPSSRLPYLSSIPIDFAGFKYCIHHPEGAGKIDSMIR